MKGPWSSLTMSILSWKIVFGSSEFRKANDCYLLFMRSGDPVMTEKRTIALSVHDLRTTKIEDIIPNDERNIDYSDIPKLTDAQLRKFKRTGGPLGRMKKKAQKK
jgi:hypothetical protein